MKKIEVVEASGDNYEIGFCMGSACKKAIKQAINESMLLCEQKTGEKYSSLVKQAQKYLDYCPKSLSRYLDEIKGIADGSDSKFNDILFLNLIEELAYRKKDRCTSVAVRTDKGVILGHNEDWSQCYENKLFLVKAEQKTAPDFMGLFIASNLAGIGVSMSSAGFAFGGNSIRMGYKYNVPLTLVLRYALDSKNLNECVKRLTRFNTSLSVNNLVVSHNKITNVEKSFSKYALIKPDDDYFVHTNHFLKIKDKHERPTQNSVNRHNEANEILNKEKRLSIDSIKKVLTSHSRKDSICEHALTKNKEESKTISSSIIDLNFNSFYVCRGNPCKSKYRRYCL